MSLLREVVEGRGCFRIKRVLITSIGCVQSPPISDEETPASKFSDVVRGVPSACLQRSLSASNEQKVITMKGKFRVIVGAPPS